MPRKEEVIQQMDWLSDRLSSQVRSVALGILALTWGLLIGADSIPGAINPSHLLFVGLLAILAMSCDFLQYAAGYRNARRLYMEMRTTGAPEAGYPVDFYRRCRDYLFAAKQWIVGLAAAWLIGLLLAALL